ncbi:hypothetical protein HZH68_000039 [Vespula germanica]|uniref:Uncharacterized protein n=2 Tax=Vespula TaxID=7451 RepID=A0A834NSV6_VESGE|nr:hypothetical protein HZH68_000039 [Vespula germanica]KAF7437612.1 hypothetical protein H0235_000003 [Vespula pensylvanica]
MIDVSILIDDLKAEAPPVLPVLPAWPAGSRRFHGDGKKSEGNLPLLGSTDQIPTRLQDKPRLIRPWKWRREEPAATPGTQPSCARSD